MQDFTSRDRTSSSSVEPVASATATATAHSSAAELESPAPTGHARHVPAVLAERPEHATGVRRPPRRPARAERVEGARVPVAGLVAAQRDDVVVAQPHRGVRRVGERHRQAEAAVVVDVLADQVHPPRGREHAERCSSPFGLELPGDRVGEGVGRTGVEGLHGRNCRGG
jgi:hypothetical protein